MVVIQAAHQACVTHARAPALALHFVLRDPCAVLSSNIEYALSKSGHPPDPWAQKRANNGRA